MAEILGYRTVYKEGRGELVEKKSRFLSYLLPVESEEEITRILEQMRKKYWDARHVCYAYVLGAGGENMRFSDDGEPSGTAGKPMLEVLTGEELKNVLVVVVRYFGGVLLGTGGLVRAYSGAAREAVNAAVLIEKQRGRVLTVSLDYNSFGKVQYLLNQEDYRIKNISYADTVTIEVPVPIGQLASLHAKISDLTNGAALLEEGDEVYFGVVDKEVLLF